MMIQKASSLVLPFSVPQSNKKSERRQSIQCMLIWHDHNNLHEEHNLVDTKDKSNYTDKRFTISYNFHHRHVHLEQCKELAREAMTLGDTNEYEGNLLKTFLVHFLQFQLKIS